MSEQNEFKVGDTVQLKSGGPVMTIDGSGTYNGDFKMSCIWFEGSKQMHGVFKPATLTAA